MVPRSTRIFRCLPGPVPLPMDGTAEGNQRERPQAEPVPGPRSVGAGEPLKD
jgi:hypothetical protein